MAVLDQILRRIREGLPALQARRDELEQRATLLPPPPSFRDHLCSGAAVALIAEVKRRSPSAGAINERLDPASLARDYEAGGASAISVLTEEAHFGGRVADLEAVSNVVSVPTLRKDFIVDTVQLVEARLAGAAAALLIVRALSDEELRELIAAARSWHLTALVEAHDRAELDRALGAGAEVIGINARNLDDFSMDVAGSLELLQTIPSHCVAVAESGMSTSADVGRAAEAGADAVLVGGALAAARDPRRQAALLAGIPRRAR
jgi:indole-3-glycerol phosphate synthase